MTDPLWCVHDWGEGPGIIRPLALHEKVTCRLCGTEKEKIESGTIYRFQLGDDDEG